LAKRETDLFLKSFGEVLRSERKKQKLSQQLLAVKAGLASNVVGDLERGNRTVRGGDLARLCLVLEVPVSSFLEKVAAAQIQALRPVEEELRKQTGNGSKTRRVAANDRERPELNVVLFGLGLIPADNLSAWAEIVRGFFEKATRMAQ
jgi:transcriptional regulator with XRE-family HTH domain